MIIDKQNLTKIALIAAFCVVGFSMATAATTKKDKPLTQKTFINLAKKAKPTVVSIVVSRDGQTNLNRLRKNHGQDQPFHFFLDPKNPLENIDPEIFRSRQAGSGVIIRSNGFVVTNEHVIRGAQGGDVSVELFDGTKYEGDDVEIIGSDTLTDLAVLKVNAKKLIAAKWAESKDLEVGQWVLAVGDPMELRNSVTQGIISAIGRDIGNGLVRDYIQTTAIINPGNSGGALVDLENNVVGINVLISTNTGRWQGVAFTIPSNTAKRVTDDLVEHGKVVRGFVGVTMKPLTDRLRNYYNYEGEGVWAERVSPGGPAETSGLEENDIIVGIDGEDITSTRHMLRVVASKRVGDKIKFKLFREGDYKSIIVEIGERPSDKLLSQRMEPREIPKIEKPKARLGIQVEPVNDDALADDDQEAIVITDIISKSLAAINGLKIGDKIYQVNGMRVRSAKDVRTALELKKEVAMIKYHREDAEAYVIIKLD